MYETSSTSTSSLDLDFCNSTSPPSISNGARNHGIDPDINLPPGTCTPKPCKPSPDPDLNQPALAKETVLEEANRLLSELSLETARRLIHPPKSPRLLNGESEPKSRPKPRSESNSRAWPWPIPPARKEPKSPRCTQWKIQEKLFGLWQVLDEVYGVDGDELTAYNNLFLEGLVFGEDVDADADVDADVDADAMWVSTSASTSTSNSFSSTTSTFSSSSASSSTSASAQVPRWVSDFVTDLEEMEGVRRWKRGTGVLD